MVASHPTLFVCGNKTLVLIPTKTNGGMLILAWFQCSAAGSGQNQRVIP